MFPDTEELPPEGREINPVSLLPEERLFGLLLLGDVGSALFAHGLCGVIRQLLGEQQEGQW